jgi:hypothetical protein
VKPEEFKPPTTLQEAKDRHARLASERAAVERQLTERRLLEGSHGSAEYARWRKAAVLKVGHQADELRMLREWVKSYHADRERTLVGGETFQSMRQAAVTPFFNFLEYAKGLLGEVAELRAENDRLRELLRDRVSTSAPGDGVDEWREQA